MILSDADLKADCLLVVASSANYAPGASSVIYVLNSTGCREGEALDRSLWSLRPDLDWNLKPQKGNPSRIIPASDLPAPFVSWLLQTGYPYSLSSLNNLRRIIRTFSHYPDLYCGAKGISSHRFRHNKIRQLYASGKTTAQIQVIMGLTSASVVVGYGTSAIYT